MKAVRVHTPGGPEALRHEDAPEPTPKPGEAVVKIDAAGLNYIDVYFRSGLYKADLPATIGMEGGGTVVAVGPGVKDVKVGDKVAYTGVRGAYAEQAAVPADRLVKLPKGVSTKQGAAAMLQGTTAHYLACSSYLTRASLNHSIATRGDLQWRAGEVLGWVRDGKLRLRMEFEYPLKDAAEAHRALEGRKTTGKVLLIP